MRFLANHGSSVVSDLSSYTPFPFAADLISCLIVGCCKGKCPSFLPEGCGHDWYQKKLSGKYMWKSCHVRFAFRSSISSHLVKRNWQLGRMRLNKAVQPANRSIALATAPLFGLKIKKKIFCKMFLSFSGGLENFKRTCSGAHFCFCPFAMYSCICSR